MPCSLFAAGNSHSKKQNAFLLKLLDPSLGIQIKAIAAIN